MAVTLVKVDDRMIHGQIVIMWTKLRQGDALIVVADDETAKDEFLKRAVQQGGNAVGKKTYVFSVEEAIDKLPKAIASKTNYFVIGKTIKQLYQIYKGGVNLGNDIQFGTASVQKPGCVKVWQVIYLSPEDMKMCEELHKMGVEITFKLIPEESGTTWKKEREKLLGGIN